MEKLRRLKLILVAAAVILATASIANSTSTQSDWTNISYPVSSTSETGQAADTTSLTEPETTKGDSSAAATTSSSSSSSSTTSTTTTTPAVTSASTTTTPAVTSASTTQPAVISASTTTPAVISASTTTTPPAVTSASTTTPAVTSASTINTPPAVTSSTTTTPAVTSASTTTTPAVTSASTTPPAVTSASTTTPAITSAPTTTTTPAVTSTPTTTTTTTSNTPSYTADHQSTTQGTQFSGIDESSSLSTESTTTTTPKSTMTPGERGTLPLNIWNQLRISLSVKLLNTSRSRDEIRDGLIIPSFGSCPAYLFSTVDEPTVSTNQRDPIFTFHVTYDAKPLIFTKSATVENVTSCMTSSIQEWKQPVLTYDGFNFDVDYLDTITLRELYRLYDESGRMEQLVSNPCTIRHVCPNECYSCSQTLLECSFNFTCSGAREHSTCMLDDVGKPYCGCPYRFVKFGGKCVHQKDKLSLLLESVGGGILGFCILLSGFCIVSVTWGKSTSMATRTYLSTMPQESNAFEPHNCKKTKTSIDDPGFYNVAFSTKEETLKRDISSGVRLRVADLDDTKSNYSTFQDRSTNLHPYSTMPGQESKGNVYSTSSSGRIKDEAKDPIAKEEAREEISTF